MKLFWMMQLLRAAEGEGGGQGGSGGQGGNQPPAGGDGGAGGGQGGAGGQGGNQPPASAWKAPEGTPSHFVKDTAEASFAELYKAYDGARKTISTMGTPPADAKDYAFEFSDKAKPVLNLQPDDKVLPIVRAAAKEFNLTDRQAGFVPKIVDGLIEAGLIAAPQDPNEMWKSMAPEAFKGSDVERIAAGQAAVREAQGLIEGMTKQGWTDGMRNEALLLTGTADGLKIIKSLQSAGVIKSVQPAGDGAGQGGVTADQLAARRQDPRNKYGDPKYDPAFAQETERLYKAAYPD